MQAQVSAARVNATGTFTAEDVRPTRWSTEHLAFLLLVSATVTWRAGVFYEGGVDAVVVGKAAMSLVALSIAWHASQQVPSRRRVGNRSMWLLVAYLSCSMFGSWAAGTSLPTLVLSTRLLTVAATISLLARVFSPQRMLHALLSAMGSIALIAALSGIPSFVQSGRLQGGWPPSKPNELAVLSCLALLGLVWLMLHARASRSEVALVCVFLAIVWMTGSRTALAAVVIGSAIMLLQARRLRAGAAFGVLGAAVAVTYIAFFTDVLGSYFQRGGAENVTTLNSRTIAWSAAFQYADGGWSYWMGVGIATKKIPVAGQYWQEQLLDSSWISALVQGGRVGVVILGVWLTTTFIASCRREQPLRMLVSGLAAFLMLRSFLESGLLDGTPVFVAFFTVSLLSDRVTRRAERQRSVA